MQNTLKGFNTAVIKHEDHFLALLLKVKSQNDICQTYYLQAPQLADLCLILQSRINLVAQRISEEGDTYKEKLNNINEIIIAETPEIEISEIEEPDSGQRITSLTFAPGNASAKIVAVLQNKKTIIFNIDDTQVDALSVAIQQALINSNENDLMQNIYFDMKYLMLYTVDLSKEKSISYQQHIQEDWKTTLYKNYLAILFCFETPQGKKILTGAIVKINSQHPSAETNTIIRRVLDNHSKLNVNDEGYSPHEIYSNIMPTPPGKILTLPECLNALHHFYREMNTKLPG